MSDHEQESETLLKELESICVQDGWRNDSKKVNREAEIRERLAAIYAAHEQM